MARLPMLPLLLRCYRAGALILIVVLVHQQARWLDAQRNTSISLRLARKFFPAATRLQLRDVERGLYFVSDKNNDVIGCLLTTSPQTDDIIGYSGPNNLLVVLDAHGAIVGLELLRSGDTKEHVERVRRDGGFLKRFLGWKPNEAPPPKIDAVSGATLTSFAIAESLQQRLAGAAPSLRFPDAVTLAEVQTLFTNAVRIVPDQTRLRVLDASGRLLGYTVRTSPQADNVAGYRGPSECLAALAPDGRTVTAIQVRKSYDTDSYVNQVRRAEQFQKLFVGRTIDELAAFNYPRERIDGVSGATRTAHGVADGLQRRFAAEIKAQKGARRWWPQPRDWALAGVIAGALVMSFTSLRGRRWVRVSWQILLVGYVGLVNHDLLSLALFGGWAANGLAFKAAPGLVLLTLAALLVPWSTRRQLYCHQICPHGAAQQLLGQLSRWRWSPSGRVARVLEFVPVLLLGGAVLALLSGAPFNLTNLEPFDAWSWRTTGWASIAIAGVGLLASLIIPQAYCRFGCPTGALLNLMRSTGSSDHWGRRDSAVLTFLGMSFIVVAGLRAWPHTEPEPVPHVVQGRAMGTTWTVKIHDEIADPPVIGRAIAKEFEWAESLTSHWRTNTDLFVFNHTATTNEFPVPWPVLTLSRWSAEISRASDGAFDVTVGPLMRLWGFGPEARRTLPPADSELEAIRPAIGWEKLEVLDGVLRKQHPAMEVDLSSIAEGWAVDQVAQMLTSRGLTNYLVAAGGELRASGRWTIAIEHPTRTCIISNESLSTSGTYRQNHQANGRQYSHLIDPRTGRPVTHRTVAATVRGDDCARADAWSTALNVLGVEAGLPLAERLNLAAQFVVDDGTGKLAVQQSSAWLSKHR